MANIEKGTSLTGREDKKIPGPLRQGILGTGRRSAPAAALPDRSGIGTAQLPDRGRGGAVCGQRKEESLPEPAGQKEP